MEKELSILKTIEFVKKSLAEAEGGHDWWHIYRVWRMARQIAETEKGDLFVIELAALLHDIADSKFHNGDESIGPQKARAFMESIHIDAATIAHVVSIIENISFKGGKVNLSFTSPELEIVMDADRLDAQGAIGIARTFNYGGFKGREIHNPEIQPDMNQSKEQYKHSKAPTINHFYEKLLLLKDRMNTKTGKIIAEQRHDFMISYLNQFYAEWEALK